MLGGNVSARKIIFIGFLVGLGVFLGGCTTIRQPIVIASDEYIITAQRAAYQLATISERIGNTLQFAATEIDRIRKLAGYAGGGITNALRLLDEYDELFQELVNRITQLEYAVSNFERENTTPK